MPIFHPLSDPGSSAWRLLRAGLPPVHGDRVGVGARPRQPPGTPWRTLGRPGDGLDGESRDVNGRCLLMPGCGRTGFQRGDAAAPLRLE